MNDQDPQLVTTAWQRLARQVSESQPIPDGPHFIDDDDVLDRWQDGDLPAEQHAQLISHLGQCRYCRDALNEMMDAGVFVLSDAVGEADSNLPKDSDVTEQGAQQNPSVSINRGTRWWTSAGVFLVAAASILIAVMLWTPGDPGGQRLAQLQISLNRGEATKTLSELEAWYEQGIDSSFRKDADKLTQDAGYQVARDSLQRGDLQMVEQVAGRVKRLAGRSSALLNLRLQAERGLQSELALAEQSTLRDYGYQLDGRSFGKSAFPVIDTTKQRIGQEFEDAIRDFPDDPALKLNYGHFLLEINQWQEAEEQFAKAQQLEPENIAASIGAGLASFEQREYAQAVMHFERASQIEPESYSAQLNLAISLQAAGRAEDAEKAWKQAATLAPDDSRRNEIESFIQTIQE